MARGKKNNQSNEPLRSGGNRNWIKSDASEQHLLYSILSNNDDRDLIKEIDEKSQSPNLREPKSSERAFFFHTIGACWFVYHRRKGDGDRDELVHSHRVPPILPHSQTCMCPMSSNPHGLFQTDASIVAIMRNDSMWSGPCGNSNDYHRIHGAHTLCWLSLRAGREGEVEDSSRLFHVFRGRK